MKNSYFQTTSIALLLLGFTLLGCNQSQTLKESEITISIETDLGNMKLKLYNETPIHRDNFVKLVEEGFYDGIIFHRVINNFMIQGGDPSTKIESEAKTDDAGYTLDAEFNSNLYHKKGALAAARLGDTQNPEKKSSGSQFYIVQGKKFTKEELDVLANRKNDMLKKSITNRLVMEKADKMMDEGQNPDFTKIYVEMQDSIETVYKNTKLYSYNEKQVEIYSTIGGTPHLDGDYTVFGEVIEGFDVIDKIAAVKTNPGDKPVEDIRMIIKVLKK